MKIFKKMQNSAKIKPDFLRLLGFLANNLCKQGRFEEALKIRKKCSTIALNFLESKDLGYICHLNY